MSTLESPAPHTAVIQSWRRQIGSRARLADQRGPRPYVLVSYQLREVPVDGLVPLNRITFVSMFDQRIDDGATATWVLGFGAQVLSDGVQFGGLAASRFCKDLRLSPTCGGPGRRLDAANRDTAEAALSWERHIERHARHPHYPRRVTPRMPDVWVSVPGSSSSSTTVRRCNTLLLVPLARSATRPTEISDYYIDLTSFPKRQVIGVDDPSKALCGQSGEVSFDLYHSRFLPST